MQTALLALGIALVAALPASGAGGARLEPGTGEAFFGSVVASAPAGAREAELVVDGRAAGRTAVVRGRAVFRLERRPGAVDLSVRFRARGGRPLGSVRAGRAWLLPDACRVAAGERGPDEALATRLAALGRAFHGWAGLWVQDLRSGRTAGWNSDASFPAASTVKLAVLIAALRRLGPAPERSPAFADMAALARWSSNEATNRLLVRLGGSESGGTRIAQAVLDRIGARSSTFTGGYRLGTGPTTIEGDAPRPLPVRTWRRTTAHDLGRILLALHAAAAGHLRGLRLTGLTRHEARVGLGLLLSSVPAGDNVGLLRPAYGRLVPIAQKHGWLDSVRHTAAIVYGPRGPRIVVVLTYRPGIGLQEAQALGARVAALVKAWRTG